MTNEKYHFVYPFLLNQKTNYMIWYENDIDGLVLDSDQNIMVFNSPDLAIQYRPQLLVEYDLDRIPILDLDALNRWLASPKSETIRCDLFIQAWNLFSDIAKSVGEKAFDADVKKTNPVYDKIFFGINLPAMTQEGEHYTPKWSTTEVQQIRDILSDGLELLKKTIRNNPTRRLSGPA